MVDTIAISRTINELDVLYNTYPQHSKYYAKLALLELCGWIEQTMDTLILGCSALKLVEPTNRTLVQNRIVNRTYGFHYEDHFRPMLMKLIGLYTLEAIERRINHTGDLQILASQLGSLRLSRDTHAHTPIHGATISYLAPSLIKNFLNTIALILIKIDFELQQL